MHPDVAVFNRNETMAAKVYKKQGPLEVRTSLIMLPVIDKEENCKLQLISPLSNYKDTSGDLAEHCY